MGKSRDVIDSVVERLREMIVAGTLAQGTTLPAERALAQQMDISRGTLREALGIARARGWLSSLPNGRTIVIGIDQTAGKDPSLAVRRSFGQSMADIFEFRFIVESQLAAIAAINASADDIDRLAKLHKAFLKAIDAETGGSLDRQDEAFHRYIMQISGNKVFEECYGYFDGAFRATYCSEAERRHARDIAIEHENIMQAIESRDPVRAAYFMRVHLLRSSGRHGVALKKTPLAL